MESLLNATLPSTVSVKTVEELTLADSVEEGQVQERTLVQPLRTRPPGEETSQREEGQIAEVIGTQL